MDSFISSESFDSCVVEYENGCYVFSPNTVNLYGDYFRNVTIEYHLGSLVFYGLKVISKFHQQDKSRYFKYIYPSQYKKYCIKDGDFFYKKMWFWGKEKKFLKDGRYIKKSMEESFYIFSNFKVKR